MQTLLQLMQPASTGSYSVPSVRSEEHTSELQSPEAISYAVFCLKKRKEKEDVALRSLDREFYDDFEIFLRTDREMKPKTAVSYTHLDVYKRQALRYTSEIVL